MSNEEIIELVQAVVDQFHQAQGLSWGNYVAAIKAQNKTDAHVYMGEDYAYQQSAKVAEALLQKLKEGLGNDSTE